MAKTVLPPTWRNLLLTVHVASAVSLLGTDLVLLILGVASVNGADPVTVYPAASIAGTWLLGPLAVAALGTGLLLGLLTPWGVFRYWWVTIKLTLTAVLTVAVLLVLVPRLGAMAEAVTGGDAPVLSRAERLPLILASTAGSTLLVLALALAVFKPGWRLGSGQNAG